MAGQASASARVVVAFVGLVLEVAFASVHLVEASVVLAFAFVQAVD